MLTIFLAACELKRKVPAFARDVRWRATAGSRRSGLWPRRRTFLLPAHLLAFSSAAYAQDHAPAAEAGHAAGQSITDMILGLGWPLANFVIFVGVLYYFLNQPLKDYLANRSATIRKELVEAAALNASAAAQLATIEQKLQALPGELDALRKRGAGEIEAEEQRIAAAAASDRDRLLEQTRREIDLQVRLAKKEILEHAADLSVQLATERIKIEITPADQNRLVDRYLDQVKGPQAPKPTHLRQGYGGQASPQA